jgi:hypothetical protein
VDDAAHYQTRPIPQSLGAQARYLLRRERGNVRAAAARVGVSESTFRRWTRSKALKARATPARAAALRREVTKEWQPGLRRRAERQLAAGAQRVTVEMRGTFGYDAPAGTTDQARLRRITQTLPANYAQQLAQARAAGGSEQAMRDIVAKGLGEVYFRDSGRRASGLEVRITDIDYIQLEFE